MGFAVKRGSEKGFPERVLRRGYPEGVQNDPSESTTP